MYKNGKIILKIRSHDHRLRALTEDQRGGGSGLRCAKLLYKAGKNNTFLFFLLGLQTERGLHLSHYDTRGGKISSILLWYHHSSP